MDANIDSVDNPNTALPDLDIEPDYQEKLEEGIRRSLGITDDRWKQYNDYLASKENFEACEPFERLNQKFLSLARQYKKAFDELFSDVEARACRREYCMGGETIHRGFYSPSAMDLVVKGVRRGSLLESASYDDEYTHEYLFDDRDNLICIYRYTGAGGSRCLYETEILVYEDGRVLALTFSANVVLGLCLISECRFDDSLLISYEAAQCPYADAYGRCQEVQVEEFEYLDGLLQSFAHATYMPANHSLRQDRYTFMRDEEGYLSTYTVERLDGFRPIGYVSDDDAERLVHDVVTKRGQQAPRRESQRPTPVAFDDLERVYRERLEEAFANKELSPILLIDAFFTLYIEIEVEHPDDQVESDDILFEYGVFGWVGQPGKHFTFSLVRQLFLEEEGEPYQLRCELAYDAKPFVFLESECLWSMDYDDYGEFCNQIFASEGYKLASQHTPKAFNLYFEYG